LTGANGARVLKVPLEDYVLATVLAEFAPPRGDLDRLGQMIEVQSVVNRTYALSHRGRHAGQGFDVCASTHCQLYRSPPARSARWAAIAADAVRRTAATVLWFDSAPAPVLYHADCGGHTSGATAVWGGAAPQYLRARPDDGAAASAHASWEFRVERDALHRALNADRRTSVGARLDLVQIVERDDAGRAALVLLQGARQPLVRGEEVRGVLVRAFGARSVRSTLFAVARQGDTFVFAGRGFGHGVGLCQAGAFARIQAGATPEEVLALYFPGTTQRRIDD
jgi:stage II sporulation protein D